MWISRREAGSLVWRNHLPNECPPNECPPNEFGVWYGKPVETGWVSPPQAESPAE